MSKPIFYEGQEVGCLINGEGIVRTIDKKFQDRVIVEFEPDRRLIQYSLFGYQNPLSFKPTLYPIDQFRSIIANLPAPQPEAWKPKPGEWCWFRIHQYMNSMAVLARFAQMGERGYMAKINGGLSSYDFCAPFTGELPEHLKEVQP